MTSWPEGLVLLACLGLPRLAAATVFAGEVVQEGAEEIIAPASNINPVVLRYYMPDGAAVRKGDVILRVDATSAANNISQATDAIDQARANIDKEVAAQRVKALDAELAVVDAEAALQAARVDAAIPRSLLSALDYDRYQTELQRSTQSLALKQKELEEARTAIERRIQSGNAEIRKQEVQRDYSQQLVDNAVVKAGHDGVVVHEFNNLFSGGRTDEGSSTYSGTIVGRIYIAGVPTVRAWVLEPDRAELKLGQPVLVAVDALPGRRLGGRITAISAASAEKPEWGTGRYFNVNVAFDDAKTSGLLPGMSVRLDSAPAQANRLVEPPAPLMVSATGEFSSRNSVVISPPELPDVYQLTVATMAEDGRALHAGDVLATFDASAVAKQLADKQGQLQQRQRELERLQLDLSDRAQSEQLTVLEAEAAETKAQRKASVPEAIVAGVDFRKLVIARRQAEQRLVIVRRHGELAARARAVELATLQRQLHRLQEDVAILQSAVTATTVKAPRDGIFMHAMGWDGQRIDAGKMLFLGQSLGQLPDLGSMIVTASLPERELEYVRAGGRVTIVVSGGSGQTLGGTIESVGRTVHSKSRVEPVPVVDLIIVPDASGYVSRPGTAVRVEIPVARVRRERT